MMQARAAGTEKFAVIVSLSLRHCVTHSCRTSATSCATLGRHQTLLSFYFLSYL